MSKWYNEFNLQLFNDEGVEDIVSDESAEDFYLDEFGELQTGKPPADTGAEDEDPDEDGEDETDEDDAEDSQAEQPVVPDKVKVKTVDGEEEVTLEELKLGYMRQRDYTSKTTEVANQRRIY